MIVKGPTSQGYLISVDFLNFRKFFVSTISFYLIKSMENTLGVKKARNIYGG